MGDFHQALATQHFQKLALLVQAQNRFNADNRFSLRKEQLY